MKTTKNKKTKKPRPAQNRTEVMNKITKLLVDAHNKLADAGRLIPKEEGNFYSGPNEPAIRSTLYYVKGVIITSIAGLASLLEVLDQPHK